MAYEDSYIKSLGEAERSPASPQGLRQTARAAQDAAAGSGPYADSYIGRLVGGDPKTSLAGDAAQSWYTGANLEGTSNGWDTGFYNEAQAQQREQLEKANAAQDGTVFYDWFERTDATGVASWNDERRDIRAGDVFDKGRKVGNLYDQFDRYTADVMMAEMLLDSETKEKIFADPDRQQWLRREIEDVVAGDSGLLEGTRRQKDLDADVTQRQEALLEGAGDTALAGGTALGGAALGAGFGSFAGPVGTAVGAGVGALVGGVSGWLNRDQLTEQAARAMEVTERANQRFGDLAGFTTGLREYSGVGLRMLNPTSNLVQGLDDARRGDGRAEFYEVDENGERKRSGWMAAADLGATLVDSVMQFSSPLGIAGYMAGTLGHVVGQAGTVAATGTVWDDRMADFNELDGGKEWAAALGSVGIDAVQLGFAGAIAKAGAASRAAFATAESTPGRVASAAATARQRLMPWTGPKTYVDEATGAAVTTSTKTINGMKFTVRDDTGEAVAARATWTLLAPSEVLRWVPTTWRARVRADLSAGAPGYDDYYRAALSLAGGNRVSAAIVNGWAEGGEEAVQALLDQVSVSADLDPGQVVEAALYGAAAGAGMSLGRVSAPASDEQVEKWRAKALYMRRNAVELDETEWDSIWSRMSRSQRTRAAKASPEEQQEVADTLRMISEAQTPDLARTSTIGVLAFGDLRKSMFARDTAAVNPAVDGSLVLQGLDGSHVVAPDGRILDDELTPNTGAMTAWQTVANVVRTLRGQQVQARDLDARAEAAKAELAAATEGGDAETIAAAQQKLDRIGAEAADSAGQLQVTELVASRLHEMYEEYRTLTDAAAAEAKIGEINAYLDSAFYGRLTDETGAVIADDRLQEHARRAVELRMGRHPFIDKSSFILLRPQISKALTLAETHGAVYTHQATLKALGGDHDGDFMVTLNTKYLPAAQLESLRRGDQYLVPVDGGVDVAIDAPDAEPTLVDTVAQALRSSDSAVFGAAYHELTTLKTELYRRYASVLDDAVLVPILNTFEAQVRRGNAEARLNLARALFNADTQRMLKVGEPGLPEPLWLMARISRAWDATSKAVAANDADLQMTPAETQKPRLPVDKAHQVALARQEAATDGQTMGMLNAGDSPVRDSQQLHYSLYRAAVEYLGLRETGYVTELQNEFIEMFARLGSDMTQSELDAVRGRNATQKRVVFWLEKIAGRAMGELGLTKPEAMLLLANTKVGDIRVLGPNQYEVTDGDVSLLQLLLKRSVEIDLNKHRKAADDSDIKVKLRKLESLTRRNTEDAGHSHTAQLAMMEVFGHVQIHRLLGDSSKYLGPQLTLNQLLASVTNLSEEKRTKIFYRWRARAPYASHDYFSNPPYDAAETASGRLHGYKILVDAVIASANKQTRAWKRADERAYADFVSGLGWLQSMVGSYRKQLGDRLKQTDDLTVLREMLEKNPSLAGSIAAIIPDAAKVGAFQQIDGRVHAAPWVEQMLVEPDPGRAAVTYFVQSKFAEWNAMGGNIDESAFNADGSRKLDPVTGAPVPIRHPRSYEQIKSRFLQTLYRLAQEPDGFEMNRFILAATSAPSPQALMEMVNSEPMWRGGRAPLYAFYDDVAAFEADPSEVWTANLPGTLQREALRTFATKTQILSSVMAEAVTDAETEQMMLTNIENFLDGKGSKDNAKRYAELLEAAITNRRLFPDATGRAAREQLIAVLQSGVIRMQDKGKADPAVAPFGEPLVTMDEFGVKLSVFQELDALTALDPDDVASNLTKLADGPVRVGLADGSTVLVDLSTPRGALAALKNPATNAFAKAVLFPTVRDINDQNVVQAYQDVTKFSLKTMLEEQTFHHLFPGESGRLTVEQAYRYIGTLEAGIRKAAMQLPAEEQDRAFFPIQQTIDEFVVAYTHRTGSESLDPKRVRDELVVEIAEALQATSSLRTGTQQHAARDVIKGKLRERFQRDSSALRQMFERGFEAAIADVAMTDATASSYARTAAQLQAQMADPSLSDEERAALQTQLDRVSQQALDYVARIEALRDADMVPAAINMFTLSGDPVADLTRKAEIRRILGAQNRIRRFQGDYRLIRKVSELLASDPMEMVHSTRITDQEWSELGAWAATVYLSEMGGHAGSSVTLTSIVLGPEGASQRRYFDLSWGYLVDGLFDEQVLKQAQYLARQAKYAPGLTPSDVAGKLETGLLNPKKLGQWSDRIVPESLKARQVLSSASVGMAIPTAGDSPKELADYVGAGWNLFQMPTPDMLATDVTFRVDAMDGSVVYGTTPEERGAAFLKLNNHFASRVVLRGLDVNGQVEVDLLPEVGEEWWGDDSVRDSGYKVVSVDRINRAVSRALEAHDFVGDPELVVDYFDVDTKPFAREWANNVYFDGVGRAGATSTGPGPVAEMVFAPGALSKVGQQNPLDQATRGGKSYRSTATTPLETVLELEAAGPSVAEVLRGKALHMLGKEYDTGYLLPGDSTALYKLMKQRHVVVGLDATGEKEVWWSERAIAWQAEHPGEPLPLTDARLVQLTDSQAQVLLGMAGPKGQVGVITKPVFNLADVDPFPTTDAARLEKLGMTRLGEESELEDVPFARMLPLPESRWSPERGKSGLTRYEEAIQRFRGEQLEVRTKWTQVAGTGASKVDLSEINRRNGQALRRMLSVEALAPVFVRMKIPFPDLNDMAGLKVSEVLLDKLTALGEASPSRVIWQHRQTQGSHPAIGILGPSALKDDFRSLGSIPPPTFEDVVVIDMAEMEAASGGNLEDAYQQGKAVIRQYARRGVTVALSAADGGVVLRNQLAAHLREGREGYAQMAESPHIFAPINEDTLMNQTLRALDSTLVEVQQLTARGIVGRHLSDHYGSASSENAVHLDLRDDTQRWQGVSVTLLPTALSGTAGGRSFAYGLPVQGTGQFDQQAQLRDGLLPLLRKPETRQHLKRLSGGDPKDVPVYRENPNGTVDPGILSFDDAYDLLVAQLESNTPTVQAGQTLQMGQLVALLGADNTVLLSRVGFQLPSVTRLDEQLKTPIGQDKPTAGERGAEIGIAVGALQSSWTVRPPFTITKVNDDPLVGLAVEGVYDLSVLGKGVLETDGYKGGHIPMPNDLAFPDAPLSDNGLRITEAQSQKSVESKAAVNGQVYHDFRWAFATSGIDFREDMVNFFLGEAVRDEDQFEDDWAVVATLLKRWAARKPGLTASEIRELLDTDTFFAYARSELNELGATAFGNGFALPGADDPTVVPMKPGDRLAQALLATLMAPGIQLDHVISTSGLMSLENLDGEAQITLMPQLFTDALNDVNYPELRNMLIDRVNARMPRNDEGLRLYELGYDWQFRIRMRNPLTGRDELVPGVLQWSLEVPADENPVNYVQASVRSSRQAESQHVGFVVAETTSGRVAMERPLSNVDRLFSDEGIARFGSPEDGGFWSLLHAVPDPGTDPSYKPWERVLPLQQLYAMEADKKVRRYRQPVDKGEASGWKAADVARINGKVDRLLEELRLGKYGEEYRVEVDYLVRQFFGRPAAEEGQGGEIGQISPAVYEQAVELMLTNVRKNLLPTYGGIVPLLHHTFLALVKEAQVGEAKPWAPKLTPKRKSKLAGSWGEWVFASFGQMRESNEEFHSMFRMDLDGFMHSYQGTTPDFGSMAMSTDEVRALKLMDEEANTFLMSLDPNQEVLLADPVILDTMKTTLDALVGYDPVVASEFAREVPTSDFAKQIEYQAAWLAGKRLPKQKKTPMRSYLEEGARYQESSRDTHNLLHGMVNMSIIMRLANPALWASAIIEVPIRNSIEHGADLLSGRTTGIAGRAISRAGAAAGAQPRFSVEDIRKIDKLAETLGASNEFLAEIYDQLTYHSLVEVGRGRWGKSFERGASLVARATSDPRFGMLAKSVGKRYLMTALEELEQGDHLITVDQLVAEMSTNPLYLKENFGTERFNPHQAGLNRIAQVRSVKGTTASKLLMGSIDSMTSNPNFGWNFTGHMLKIPFLFTRFNSGAVVTMTGMSGFDQMAAMFFDSRRSPFFGRIKAAMKGVEYNPAEFDPIDMSDVLEGTDLMRPFVKGAITHAGLMALGMMAGGLGLSGEDEEAKRRRRLATYLGTPVYYDSLSAQNDFRYADSIFLDAIPGLDTLFRDDSGRSAVQPHWIMRQFLSPVIGMERFFATGDIRQVKWGFGEAFSVIPTSVTRLWSEADLTADLLAEAAKETEGAPTPEARSRTTQLLINMVGVYERALLESSFVNAIRSGADKYNRNPWVLIEPTEEGVIKRDRMGNPQPTRALQTFRNEEGEIQQGYASREYGGLHGALVHQYAENNATAAILMSLFTGQWSGESTYLRQNMAVSTKKLELPVPSKAAAEALVLSAFAAPGEAGPYLTLEEVERSLKARDQAAGKWWVQAEITAEAQEILKAHQDKNSALSLLDKDGREIVTKAGADGIYRSLMAGAIELGDESLRGVYIPFEMRQELEREWVAELIQDGVDYGLDETAAKYRAKRLWFGNSFEEGQVGGLRALLWSDAIPINGKVTYNQLNTTYMIGPDGRPWATPFKRTNLMQAFGLPWPHTTHDPAGKGGLTIDSRGNIVDNTLGGHREDGSVYSGINTGLAALERVEESWKIEPPEPETLDDVFNKTFTAAKTGDGADSGGKKYGYTPWKRSGYGGYGGYGGGGSAYFTKMYGIPDNVSPYGNSVAFINTSNPILRRAFVRRERISSERGRLNQWQ